MKIRYDKQADAIYILLSEEPYAYGRDLDEGRRIDYSSDNKPVGIELLCVSQGINLDDLPEQAKVAKLLEGKHIKVLA